MADMMRISGIGPQFAEMLEAAGVDTVKELAQRRADNLAAKLEEINEKTRLLRRGQRVLDLGASPGSWTLFAAEKVGREGRVLGLDIQPHRSALPNNAEIIVLDVHDVDVDNIGQFDLVAPQPVNAGAVRRRGRTIDFN